jgi:hypothetical protein
MEGGYGVKGMKWGKRNPKKSPKKSPKKYPKLKLYSKSPESSKSKKSASLKRSQSLSLTQNSSKSSQRTTRISPKRSGSSQATTRISPKLKLRKLPFLRRNVRRANSKKIKILNDIRSRNLDSDSESESDSDQSDISDLIADETDIEESKWRASLDKYLKEARQGKAKKFFQ